MQTIPQMDSRYQTSDYRQAYDSQEYTSNSREDEMSAEDSQSRYYKRPGDEAGRSQGLQSSPDNNLTYSSYEGSLQDMRSYDKDRERDY